ncbi:zinc finger protein STOP1 homolog [Gastrolobium bilobum]|uniref:zinc finger protein STOP1 homolog n=1 Tax=Gastrolobium bilobum TaxID=150636 RepID=UPI002AB21ABC|nr:zinc finger protein STOP1 homolog [Gastrolobium bilobum]
MDSPQRFLSQSINSDAPVTKDQITTVSNQIVAAIHQIIVNGAALVSYSQNITAAGDSVFPQDPSDAPPHAKKPRLEFSTADKAKQVLDLKVEVVEDDDAAEDCEIVELDTMELLAEGAHSFLRDMRKTVQSRCASSYAHARARELVQDARSVGEAAGATRRRATRFSCLFEGCNGNKLCRKFRPLKSIVCVKNHFKRSHRQKMYSCNQNEKINQKNIKY